jgi:hypothetical protein
MADVAGPGGSGRLAVVAAFSYFLDKLRAERFKVVGPTTGDEALIDVHRFVNPVPAGI